MDLFLAGLLVLALVSWFVLRYRPQTPITGLLILEGSGAYETEVVGDLHYQHALETLVRARDTCPVPVACQAYLVPEDDN